MQGATQLLIMILPISSPIYGIVLTISGIILIAYSLAINIRDHHDK